MRAGSHRFVRIPNAISENDPDGRTPYNLSAAINIVLYDRLLKRARADKWSVPCALTIAARA
jgi:hypothetical protein